MPIVGTGASAPAVVAGETAEAQPAASPVVPTSIPVPTPTMGAMAAQMQALGQKIIDGFKSITNTFAAQQHAVLAFAPVYFGGSALETLGHTSAGNPTLTVRGVSTSGTPSTVATTTLTVLSGDKIAVDLDLDYQTGTQTDSIAMALYGAVGVGSPFAIEGAIQVVPDSGSPLPAIGVRTRVSMSGLHTVGSAGTLTVTLYVFVKANGDTWVNLGGGGLRVHAISGL